MATNPYATRGNSRRVDSGTNRVDVSEREDLANFISMITRDETPFMSSIGKTKATSIFHEWQTDQLAAPGDSRLVEGADFVQPSGTSSNTTPEGGDQFAIAGDNRTRLGNYTQINGKTIAVSGTKRAVDQAGVADEYAYQLKKRGTELRRDVEADLLNPSRASSGGTGTGATPQTAGTRSFGGYFSFINDPRTVSLVADNAAGTVDWALPGAGDRGEGSTAITVGSGDALVALQLSQVDEVMQNIYEEGGKATKIMVSPSNRRQISSQAQSAGSNVRRNIDEKGSLRQSVDVYMSDFGELMVVPNYILGLNAADSTGTAALGANIGNTTALIYDPMWFSIATLRPLQEVDVGQRGDSTVGMLVEECTLEVKNPVGCGAIVGIGG